MKFVSLFATALFFAGFQWSESASISTVNVEQGGSPRLINLGTVDSKSYFADNAMIRNWTEAKVFCKTLGMNLATITTSTQITFLKNVYNGTTFAGSHWIDARDSFEERQFTWDETKTPVTSLSSFTFRNTGMPFQTCLAYVSAGTPDIYVYPCETRLPTLCET
ncbi:C-type lectin domain family 2 member A [Orchesella cincta]|uniref:C-type lectin domain family 2 member A n=1 Tax=Orchesella cincta TaxID=48709 RepID=A0A1D2M781_ORCCI|nr:C-type lectin domain family 2 member A [Orchesella cincta]